MIERDYIVGDSIAAGIAISSFKCSTRSGAYGVKSTDAKGISKVGARPSEILGYLNEIGKEKFRGKNVIISTGLSNGPTDLTNIEKQLQLLKDVEAKVYMIGVSNNPPDNLKAIVNSKLETLATKFSFTFFGGFTPANDKIHPSSYTSYYNSAIKPVLSKVEDAAPVSTTVTPPSAPAQSKSVIATGPGKDFINKFNEELEKVYTKATTDLGPWKKAREEAIKITKLRKGTWPVDPAVKTIGDLFAYVFFDADGVNYKIPPYFIISNGVNAYVDGALEQQYGDWIDDMNGVSVSDPTISDIFKSLSWPYNNDRWGGKDRRSTDPITLSPSAKIIQNYTEIKKPGITNPDKYSAGQYWFDMFMSEVVGLNGLQGYLKSSKFVDDYPPYKGLHITWGSNNSRIEEIFSEDLLNNNSKIEKSFSYWGTIGDGTYSDPVYEDRKVYTMSVSKFAPNETIGRQSLILATQSGTQSDLYKYDRDNYADYGTAEYPQDEGFAKILHKIGGGGYGGFDIRKFDGLKTQYRPGINSLESLSKDPLFNPRRTNLGNGSGEIDWGFAGTQSQAAGIYWEYPVGTTASVVGNFELILLYNAFLEAGDDYKTITIPKYAPKPKEEPPVTSTLVATTESKLSGEFTFNVEKEKTFVVVGNQNFALKIGDLIIEGLTTSSVIESPKTIDLGDGIIMIDDGEGDEIDPYAENPYQGMDEEQIISIQLSEQRYTEKKQEETKKNIENNDEDPAPLKDGTPIKDAKLSEKIVILMNTLIAAGYTVNQAAGIAGNVKAESGLVQYNVENGASNIRPGGMGEKRWDSSNAKGTNYNGKSNFSGIGLCQWTYGGRYQMEKYVGKYLTDKGVSTSNLKNGFFDTDPSQFSSDYNKVYGGAGDVLEKHLSSVPYLFEAQCKFLVEYWLVTGKPSVAKNLKGKLSGNTSTICKNGIFINQTGGMPNTSTVAGACEIFLCDGEVPGPVGTAVNGKGKDKYRETVNERVKCSMDVLATYNSNKNKQPVA
jgi:hypothetical protein